MAIPWRPLAAVSAPRARAISRTSRHHLSRQAGGGGAQCGLWPSGEGLGIRARSGLEVAPNTVLHWLVEAAEQLRASAYSSVSTWSSSSSMRYAVLRDKRVRSMTMKPSRVWSVHRPGCGRRWTPSSSGGGRYRQPHAGYSARVVHQVVQVLAPGCVPSSDGRHKTYTRPADPLRPGVQPARRQTAGPIPKPAGCPATAALRAVIRHTGVGALWTSHTAGGTGLAIAQVSARCGWGIGRRLSAANLDIRQRVARSDAGSNPLSERSGRARSVTLPGLSQVLPHASLRSPPSRNPPTAGPAKQWRPVRQRWRRETEHVGAEVPSIACPAATARRSSMAPR